MKLLLPKGAVAPLKFDASKCALFDKMREPIPGCGRQNPIAVERLIPLWTQDLFQALLGPRQWPSNWARCEVRRLRQKESAKCSDTSCQLRSGRISPARMFSKVSSRGVAQPLKCRAKADCVLPTAKQKLRPVPLPPPSTGPPWNLSAYGCSTPVILSGGTDRFLDDSSRS